jgi:hypothetical protein
MIKRSTIRRAAALAGGTAALGVGALAATPASAAQTPLAASAGTAARVVTPFAAQGCSGDACIHLTTPQGGRVTVRGRARNQTFYGHFEMTGPNGLVRNSPNTWNFAGGNGHSWTVPAVVGQYCITAWEYYGHHYFNLGRACKNVK